jgi:hypothetical protein
MVAGMECTQVSGDSQQKKTGNRQQETGNESTEAQWLKAHDGKTGIHMDGQDGQDKRSLWFALRAQKAQRQEIRVMNSENANRSLLLLPIAYCLLPIAFPLSNISLISCASTAIL